MAKEDIKKYEFTSEQDRSLAAQNGRKGGLARGEQRREQKKLRELVNIFGSLNVKGKQEEMMRDLGVPKEFMNRFMQCVVSLFQKAMKGDVSAFNAIRDIIGEKPIERTQMSADIETNVSIGYIETGIEPVSHEDEIV